MENSTPFQLCGFCVIVPMYNEQSGAEDCVRSICLALGRIQYSSRLFVVNDGSRDGTGAILKRLAPDFPALRVIEHEKNAGYGAALRSGISAAVETGYDYALFMDSDLTNDPADIPKFVAAMERGIDVIKGSRFVRGGSMDGVPWRRSIFSHTGNYVARNLFRIGIQDCTNGFRAVKVPILGRMDLRETGFPIIVEELYQAKSLARTFCEVPVVLTSRGEDQRQTSFSYNQQTLRKYMGFALKAFFSKRLDPNERTC
jgi:dolichol-phosphate mannosyltransferase